MALIRPTDCTPPWVICKLQFDAPMATKWRVKVSIFRPVREAPAVVLDRGCWWPILSLANDPHLSRLFYQLFYLYKRAFSKFVNLRFHELYYVFVFFFLLHLARERYRGYSTHIHRVHRPHVTAARRNTFRPLGHHYKSWTVSRNRTRDSRRVTRTYSPRATGIFRATFACPRKFSIFRVKIAGFTTQFFIWF